MVDALRPERCILPPPLVYALPPECSFDDLVAQREGWERMSSDPTLTDVLLNTPIEALRKKTKISSAHFTAGQQK